ncbi:MAG: flagellar basal body P-ring protein FlgI [Phycisphaerales bacterium]
MTRRMSCTPRPNTTRSLMLCALLVPALVLGACNRNKKPVPKPRITAPSVTQDIPAPLRGTIGAEARISGLEPTLVSGIGFVVGLDGTGGLTIPEQYAAHLEREMALNGIGIGNSQGNNATSGKTPSELLRDPNTAAVIVQAAVPPGAREGESFDLYVRAINATSLEGGRLWSTDLRIGPPSAFGDLQARVIGNARGPIFLNPFAEPGGQYDGVTRDVGRVLDGGVVTFPTKIEIFLNNPSHLRARQIVSAINTAFPLPPGEREPTARGKDESLILVQIPSKYVNDREHFLDLLSHITIDQSYPEVYARRYAQTLVSQPYLAGDMSLCLEALGERALPFISDLYDHPEMAPRLAALRAGAELGDPRVVQPLRAIALNTASKFRTDAIALLSRIDQSILVDTTLRDLLDEPVLAVRVEAYERLMERALRSRRDRIARMVNTQNGGIEASRTQIEALSRVYVPSDPVRGVARELIAGKFFLDIVPFGEPLIYITQQKEPRIVLFGERLALQKPLLATAWSDRLMLTAEDYNDPVRLYYRDERTRVVSTMDEIPERLPALIELLAHQPSPEDPRPGLGFSYAQVVGALYQIAQDKGVEAAFTTEQDRLLAELLGAAQTDEVTIRPETSESNQVLVPIDDPSSPVVGENQAVVRERRTLLVPVIRTDEQGNQIPREDMTDEPAREE